jgi:hypothetical protein
MVNQHGLAAGLKSRALALRAEPPVVVTSWISHDALALQTLTALGEAPLHSETNAASLASCGRRTSDDPWARTARVLLAKRHRAISVPPTIRWSSFSAS